MLVLRKDMDFWPKSFMLLFLMLVGLQIGFGRGEFKFEIFARGFGFGHEILN